MDLQITRKLMQGRMALLLVEQNVGIAFAGHRHLYVMAPGRIIHEIGTGQWGTFLSAERLASVYLGAY